MLAVRNRRDHLENINTKNQREHREHHLHFNSAHLPISHTAPYPPEKESYSLFWSRSGTKRGKKRQSKRTFGFLKNTSPANTFASPPPETLSSKITAVKGDKSKPEPSADSNLHKKIYSSATRATLFLLPLLILEKLDSDHYGKKPAVWVTAAIPRGLGKIQRTAANSCCEINCNWGEGGKRGWIHSLLHMIPFWPQKSWFLFSLPNKKLLLPSYLKFFSQWRNNNGFTTNAPLRWSASVGIPLPPCLPQWGVNRNPPRMEKTIKEHR